MPARTLVIGLIGIGEMRHQAHFSYGRQTPEPIEYGGQLAGRKTQTVHAGIDLDPDGERTTNRGLLQHLQLRGMVQHRAQLVAVELRQVVRGEEPFEQADRRLHAGGPQRHGFLNAGHHQGIRRRQGLSGPEQAVPIGIGLDDRHDPRARRLLPDEVEVVTKCLGIE